MNQSIADALRYENNLTIHLRDKYLKDQSIAMQLAYKAWKKTRQIEVQVKFACDGAVVVVKDTLDSVEGNLETGLRCLALVAPITYGLAILFPGTLPVSWALSAMSAGAGGAR